MRSQQFNSNDFIKVMEDQGYSSRVCAESLCLESTISFVATRKLWLSANSIEFIANEKPLRFRHSLFYPTNLGHVYFDQVRRIVAYRVLEISSTRHLVVTPFISEAWHIKPVEEFLGNLKPEKPLIASRPQIVPKGILAKIFRQKNNP